MDADIFGSPCSWHEKCRTSVTAPAHNSVLYMLSTNLFRGNTVENTATVKKSLGAIRRKTVDLSHFSPVRESQLSETELLPLVMNLRQNKSILPNGRGTIASTLTPNCTNMVAFCFGDSGFRRRRISSASPRLFTKRFMPNMATYREKVFRERSTPRRRIRKTKRFCITTRVRT